jgi:acetoin utilization deacetylase AcuC-like enzyme
MIKIAFSPIYRYPLPDGHRFPMIKYELLPEQLLYEGTITEDNLFAPNEIEEKWIVRTHDKKYLEQLKKLELDPKQVRRIGFPLTALLLKRCMVIAQGTIDCCLYALQHGIALNIAGGTHHSFFDRGEGFCLLNDFAIAANFLLDNKLVNQILIVDLDVHQGNGTASLFNHEHRVFTFSMHGAANYPIIKEKSDLDIALPDYTDDEPYLRILSDWLPNLIHQVKPEIILYNSGVDVLGTDKLGRLNLSREGCKQRDKYVFETCKSFNIPVAVSMGGGYSTQIKDIIEAHANTYRMAFSIF